MSAPTTSVLRKFWKPALATGAGSTSLILWFEEIIAFTMELFEFFSVLVLLLLVGPIYLFNRIVFKSTKPRREDFKPEEIDYHHGTK